MAHLKLADRDGATMQQRTTSRLPQNLRFPILLLLNLCINGALWTTAEKYFGPELGDVTKTEDQAQAILARVGYRVGVLYFIWKANYDFIDVSALTTITNTPYAYLLLTYYQVSRSTVAAFLSIEVLSIAFPTYLLHPASALHNPKVSLRNRFLLNSFQVQTAATMLSVANYVLILWIALISGVFNVFLVTHFDIDTLDLAHDETLGSLVAKLFIPGLAAKTFLLNPSLGAYSGAAKPKRFDPATATLLETLKHNFWSYDKSTKTLIRQALVLGFFMQVNTVQRALTLRNSDFTGAMGVSAPFMGATLVLAGWWTWVGDTEA